nr:TRAF3-interacting protein 1 [Polyrhizophydium stewartii]
MADAPQQPAGQAPAPAAAQAAPASGLPPVLDELTKKTIDILGRVIKKPPLTQKLLAKPPFRYLHDIYSELIRTCGFVPGLYTEAEMNSDNIKDKDAKVAYLTKMIDCVGIATNIELRANPLKIVAGLEPEETNAMLQLIGKVVIKKVDTKNAVARVLAGEHQGKKPAAPADPSAQEDSSADPRIPQATIKRRERPISARPAPPKQRPAEVAPEEAPTNTPAIISDGHHKDDEDDEFVVRAVEALKMVGRFVWEYVEAGFRLTRALLNQNPDIRGSTPQLDEKHGGLVQKILQTKKDLEARAPGEGGADSDEARRSTGATGAPSGRETRSSALKEIEALRESIQLLCQSTNPLGKTMDYMQEDVDSMNKELDMWRKECHAFKQLLESETKQSAAAEGQSGAVQGTLESLAPLEQQLKSFEDGIEDQLERIASAKAVILQNDSSIQKILRNITVAGKMDS